MAKWLDVPSIAASISLANRWGVSSRLDHATSSELGTVSSVGVRILNRWQGSSKSSFSELILPVVMSGKWCAPRSFSLLRYYRLNVGFTAMLLRSEKFPESWYFKEVTGIRCNLFGKYLFHAVTYQKSHVKQSRANLVNFRLDVSYGWVCLYICIFL